MSLSGNSLIYTFSPHSVVCHLCLPAVSLTMGMEFTVLFLADSIVNSFHILHISCSHNLQLFKWCWTGLPASPRLGLPLTPVLESDPWRAQGVHGDSDGEERKVSLQDLEGTEEHDVGVQGRSVEHGDHPVAPAGTGDAESAGARATQDSEMTCGHR